MSNLRRAREIAAQRKKRNVWRNVVTCIAAFVVFCTTYALILPAITMEKESLSCGLPEHSHTAQCRELVCGRQEIFSHTHTKPECYDGSGVLTCTLQERTLHHHSSGCYSAPQPACGLAEQAAHVHTDDCYSEDALICTLAEGEGHAHTDGCYPPNFVPELICGQQDIEEHRHSAECYRLVCGMEEHTHSDACAGSHEEFLENLDQLTPTESDTPTVTQAPEQTEQTPTADTAPVSREPSAPQDGTDAPTQPPLLAASRMAADGQTEKLVDVAQTITISAADVSFDADRQEYSAKVDLSFHLTTRQGEDGKYYIVREGQTENCGNEFLLNLGEVAVANDLLGRALPLWDGGRQAGTFHYEKSGDEIVLRINLQESYVSGAQDGISGNISFGGIMGAKRSDDQGNIKYPVDGDLNLVIPEDKVNYPEGVSARGDLSAGKHGNYTIDGRTLSYTVHVSSKSGTPGTVQLEDFLTANGLSIEALESVTVGGQPFTDYTHTHTDEGEKITLTLPQLSADGGYDIQYVYRLREAPKNATVVNNRAKVSSEPDTGGKKIEVEREYPVTVQPDPPEPTQPEPTEPPTEPTQPSDLPPSLEKYNGWNNPQESENQTVNFWRIVVNRNKGNLVGVPLKDAMLSQYLKLMIKIEVDGQFRVLDPSEYGSHLTIDKENGTITFLDQGDGKNNNTYEIHYTTDRMGLGDWGYHEVTNVAQLGEKEWTATITDDGGKVEKELSDIAWDASGLYRMDWTATITIGKDGIPLEHKIADFTLPRGEWSSARHYFDQSSFRVFYNGHELSAQEYFETVFYDKSDDGRQVTDTDSIYMELTMRKDPSAQDAYGMQGGDKLVLTYSTYAREDDAWGGGGWVNKVEYRTKSATAEANITKPSFSKLSGSGEGGTTQVENLTGELSWKIKATIGSAQKMKKLTITDFLPEYVSVTELTATSQAPGGTAIHAALEIHEDGTVTGGNDQYSFSGTCRKEGENGFYTLRIDVTNRNTGEILTPGVCFELNLKCQIDEEYLSEHNSGTFRNTAQGTADEWELGSGEQIQEWNLFVEDPAEGALSKKNLSKWNADAQTLDYVLWINPKGADLQPGSSVVYLVDEFTYTPGTYELIYNLLQDSVRLYRAEVAEDGTMTKGEELKSGWRWTADEDNPGAEYGSEQITKILRLEVPDATPLILEYRYRLDHHKEGLTYFTLSAKNRAYFNTYPDKGDDDNREHTEWKASSASGSVYTGRSLTINKVAEGNSKITIPNTVFKVYRAVQVDGAWTWEGPITLTDENGAQRSTYVTNQYGTLMLQYKDGYETNVLYKLVETDAAEGYFVPDNPPSVKFYFRDEDDTTHTLPDGYMLQDARDLSAQSAFEDISNSSDSAEFSVQKIWLDHNGSNVTAGREGSVEFELVQVATELRQDASVTDPLISTAKVRILASRYWPQQIAELTVPKGTTITIRVTNCLEGFTEAKNYLFSQNFNEAKVTAYPESKDGSTWTYSLYVTHNVCFGISTNGDGEPDVTYSYSGQSAGGSGEETPLVVDPVVVGTITLSSANGWRWNSAEHRELVPVRGTVTTADGVEHRVWFTYYVREKSGDYKTSYSNVDGETVIGLSTGTITVTNTLPPPPTPTQITVQKSWAGFGELDYTELPFKLIRRQWDHQPTAEELQTHTELSYDDDLSGWPELTLVGEYRLTKENGWQWSSAGVVELASDYNGRYYTYFVVEQPGDYSVTCSPETSGGTLTVTNTTERRKTALEVEKQWFSYFGDNVTGSRQGSISFELHRVSAVNGQELSDELLGTWSVSQADNWKWSSEKEKLTLYAEERKPLREGEDAVNVTYTYYVKELVDENAAEKFTTEYENGGISSGTIIIKNTLESPKYELPETGGAGAGGFTLAGIALCLGAAAGLLRKRRREAH